MEMIVPAVALAIGIAIGYAVATVFANKKKDDSAATQTSDKPNWWHTRQALTGTQLQILQHLEAKKQVSITGLQEKFSFIPDRELYYRLEQIVLMGFLERVRKEGEVYYVLNEEYSGTVEDDKTVMLASE